MFIGSRWGNPGIHSGDAICNFAPQDDCLPGCTKPIWEDDVVVSYTGYTIKVHFDSETVWGFWENTTGINEIESEKRCRLALFDALDNAFPGAEVFIGSEVGVLAKRNGIHVTAPSGDDIGFSDALCPKRIPEQVDSIVKDVLLSETWLVKEG